MNSEMQEIIEVLEQRGLTLLARKLNNLISNKFNFIDKDTLNSYIKNKGFNSFMSLITDTINEYNKSINSYKK